MGGFTLADEAMKLNGWAEVEAISRKAEQIGCEALIPIAKWKGPGGHENSWGRQFETFTWAAGLAAVTSEIDIFSTCHVPFFAPTMAAKMAATVDHISGGRLGLNVVAGYNKSEFDMFDIPLREHDERYAVAAEWLEVVKRLWGDEIEFDFDGRYYSLKGAQSYPKPMQVHPPIMSAGFSPAGKQFAFENADLLFMQLSEIDDAPRRVPPALEEAAAAGREDLGLWTMIHVVCADTEREANDFVRHYAEDNADWAAARGLLDMMTQGDSRSVEYDKDLLSVFVRGSGAISIVGTPEQVVEQLEKLSDAGLSGATIAFVDYEEGLDRLGEQIMPLMVSAGLRTAEG